MYKYHIDTGQKDDVKRFGQQRNKFCIGVKQYRIVTNICLKASCDIKATHIKVLSCMFSF